MDKLILNSILAFGTLALAVAVSASSATAKTCSGGAMTIKVNGSGKVTSYSWSGTGYSVSSLGNDTYKIGPDGRLEVRSNTDKKVRVKFSLGGRTSNHSLRCK